MVFSSIPLYLDPHPNWHNQQQNQQHQANGSGTDSPHDQMLPPLPLPPQAAHLGSIRPGSMADRAQVAKVQQPDQAAGAMKCPRCESTNTKFCYYNNYSLSQPRYFCKTCRRYWTRGGTLRNVPVGGGCRRNHKKSSSKRRSRSKSPATPPTNQKQLLQQPLAATCQELMGRFPQQPGNRSLVASLQNMMGGNMGQAEHMMGFQAGGGGVEQWRLQQQQQQFPNFLGGFDSSTSYPFHSEAGVEAASSISGFVGVGDIGGGNSRVKLEGNGFHQLLMKQDLTNQSMNNNNQQYYSWTDLSGLATSSSATHLL